MWFLTVDPLILVSVFIAKPSYDKTAGVSSRTFIVKNISNSLTYTVTSSCVCTSPLAVTTVVGLLDVVTVSHSAEFKSFLLIMCIDKLESTTKSLSSGLIVDGEGRHQFSEGEKNAVLCFSINFRYFGPFSTLFHGHIALAFPSLLETDPQILECWGYADEDHLGKLLQAMVYGLECWRDVTWLWWIQHIWLAWVCWSSSAKSMKTSVAPYPEIRNPIVVYSST